MKGWVVREYGHYAKKLSWGDAPDVAVPDDGCLIDVHAAGVMYADLLNISGQYQIKAPLPFVPGSEAAGVVVEAGPKSRFKPGDRVVTVNLTGAFAEHAAGLDRVTFGIPDEMPFADAACFCINYQTAYLGMNYRGRLKAGETVLVQAGASGVGVAAIQLAKAHGARVIATASSGTKLDACRQAGADHVINYKERDFAAEVKSLTNGEGADIVFDPVGGDVFDQSTKCIAFEGRIIVIGFASGRIPEVAANRLLLKNIDVTGFFLGTYNMRLNDFVHETQQRLYELYADGKIKPIIYNEFRFDELPLALEAIESRACYGKPVLVAR